MFTGSRAHEEERTHKSPFLQWACSSALEKTVGGRDLTAHFSLPIATEHLLQLTPSRDKKKPRNNSRLGLHILLDFLAPSLLSISIRSHKRFSYVSSLPSSPLSLSSNPTQSFSANPSVSICVFSLLHRHLWFLHLVSLDVQSLVARCFPRCSHSRKNSLAIATAFQRAAFRRHARI